MEGHIEGGQELDFREEKGGKNSTAFGLEQMRSLHDARNQLTKFVNTVESERDSLGQMKSALKLEKEWIDYQRNEENEMQFALTEEEAALHVLRVLEHEHDPSVHKWRKQPSNSPLAIVMKNKVRAISRCRHESCVTYMP